jgi:hypothetical protein
MDAVQELREIEAIRLLKARYFRCIDTKEWDTWLDLFTDDATLSWDQAVSTFGADPKRSESLRGRQAIAGFVPVNLAKAQTVHQGFTGEIEIISDTDARAIWPMEDIVDYGGNVFHGYGHYHETYRKEHGRWRIATEHLSRIRLSQTFRDSIDI